MIEYITDMAHSLSAHELASRNLALNKIRLGECCEGMSRTSQYALYDKTAERWLTDDYESPIIISNYQHDKVISEILQRPDIYAPIYERLIAEIDRVGMLDKLKARESEIGLAAFREINDEYCCDHMEQVGWTGFVKDFQTMGLLSTDRSWFKTVNLNILYDYCHPNITAARTRLFGELDYSPDGFRMIASLSLKQAFSMVGLRLKRVIGHTSYTINDKYTGLPFDGDEDNPTQHYQDETIELARTYVEQPLKELLANALGVSADSANVVLIENAEALGTTDPARYDIIATAAVIFSTLNQYVGHAFLSDAAQLH